VARQKAFLRRRVALVQQRSRACGQHLATTITRDPGDNTSAAVVERTGWGGDGAPGNGTLREFIDGAIKQHYPRSLNRQTNVDFRFATNTEKDQLVAFQLALGRTADINFNNVTLTDAGAAAGRVAYMDPFQGRCNECHFNGGGNALLSGKNRNFDTGVTVLRVLNVSFNVQLAIQRLNASHTLNVAFWGYRDDIQKGLISLAREEADDALRVLSSSRSGPLHSAQQTQISTAMTLMNQALAATDPAIRRDRTASARTLLTTVKNALGTGMDFQLGTGNLMF
jgi:hypothetical protein